MTYFLDFNGTLSDGRTPYADVSEFLRMMGNEAIVVTSEPASGRAGIEHILSGIVRLTILCTDGVRKAEFLKTWPGYFGGPAVFVDDRPVELEALAAAFPMLRLFEMRRDGGVGDGRWPVVHSLTELP